MIFGLFPRALYFFFTMSSGFLYVFLLYTSVFPVSSQLFLCDFLGSKQKIDLSHKSCTRSRGLEVYGTLFIFFRPVSSTPFVFIKSNRLEPLTDWRHFFFAGSHLAGQTPHYYLLHQEKCTLLNGTQWNSDSLKNSLAFPSTCSWL